MPTTLRPVSGVTDTTPHLRRGDGTALLVFVVLIVLGLVACAVSFARM